jgi:Reverse transcriptase (RNA-dependent DNA polymerase)
MILSIASDLEPLLSTHRLAQLLAVGHGDLRAVAAHVGGFYEPFDRRKTRDEGKWRHIDNPNEKLKDIQRRIQRLILRRFHFPETMLGGVRKRSITDNASFHIDQPVVATIDLRDCFPRTSNQAVFAAFRRELHCSTAVGSLLTQLTTLHRHVPQGAPTSLSVVNLTLLPLHDAILTITKSFGLRASLWVDDITVSGGRAREAIGPIIGAVTSHGHAVRCKKIFVYTAAHAQRVTGVVVNRKTSAGHLRIQEIRGRIIDLANQRLIAENDLISVRGQITQVKSICESQGESLERLAERILPASGTTGRPARRDETRPCPNPSRHTYLSAQ